MAFKRSGVRFSYAPQKSLSEWSEGDFSCLVAPIILSFSNQCTYNGSPPKSGGYRKAERTFRRPAVPVSLVGRPCPYHVLFGHDDDVNSLTVPSRQRLRQFPKKNDATATRAFLHHRRVKTIICLSVFVTPLVRIRHPVCPLVSVSRQSARTKDRPDAV